MVFFLSERDFLLTLVLRFKRDVTNELFRCPPSPYKSGNDNHEMHMQVLLQCWS